MELVNPGIGLIFWMTLSFAIVFFILAKFAWVPILSMLKAREGTIENALSSAEKARDEMRQLQSHHEQLLKEAKEERDAILRETRKLKDAIIEEAKVKATEEAERILETAKENIHFEKMAAITDLKNQLAVLSIEVAEKVLRQELADPVKQKGYIEKIINQMNFN
jgi:F-type H+-transporting ATPase subunit b